MRSMPRLYPQFLVPRAILDAQESLMFKALALVGEFAAQARIPVYRLFATCNLGLGSSCAAQPGL